MIFNPAEVDWKNAPPTLEDCAETALYYWDLPPQDLRQMILYGAYFSHLCNYLEGIDGGLKQIRRDIIENQGQAREDIEGRIREALERIASA